MAKKKDGEAKMRKKLLVKKTTNSLNQEPPPQQQQQKRHKSVRFRIVFRLLTLIKDIKSWPILYIGFTDQYV